MRAGHTSGGVDTCQDDSDRPPLTGGVLAGITSWSRSRAAPGHPGFHTRLTTVSGPVAARRILAGRRIPE